MACAEFPTTVAMIWSLVKPVPAEAEAEADAEAEPLLEPPPPPHAEPTSIATAATRTQMMERFKVFLPFGLIRPRSAR